MMNEQQLAECGGQVMSCPRWNNNLCIGGHCETCLYARLPSILRYLIPTCALALGIRIGRLSA